MSISLPDGRAFADATVKSVNGRRILAGYVLRFEINFKTYQETPSNTRMNDYEAELRVRSKKGTEELGKLLKAKPQESVETYNTTIDISHYLEIELSQAKMDALEKTRYSGDMIFELTINGQISLPNGLHNAYQELRHTIAQSNWIKILDRMKYSHINLIEIPNLKTTHSAFTKRTNEHLNEANQLALEGRFQESIARSELVLENITQALGDAKEMRNLGQKTKDANKSERMQHIRNTVANMAHLARHDDNEKITNVEWYRHEALAMIKYCCAILQHNFG